MIRRETGDRWRKSSGRLLNSMTGGGDFPSEAEGINSSGIRVCALALLDISVASGPKVLFQRQRQRRNFENVCSNRL